MSEIQNERDEEGVAICDEQPCRDAPTSSREECDFVVQGDQPFVPGNGCMSYSEFVL